MKSNGSSLALLLIVLGLCAFTGCRDRFQRPMKLAPPQNEERTLIHPQPLLEEFGNQFHPNAHPITKDITFVSDQRGNQDIYFYEARKQTISRLTQSTADDFMPSLSPDGNRIAWVSRSEDAKGDIWLIDTQGSNPIKLTNNFTQDTSPSWLSNNLLVFATQEGINSKKTNSVVLYDLVTHKASTLSNQSFSPQAQPQSEQALFIQKDPKTNQRTLCLYSHKNKTIHILGKVPQHTTSPFFFETSPESQVAYLGATVFNSDTNNDQKIDNDDLPSIYRFAVKKNKLGILTLQDPSL